MPILDGYNWPPETPAPLGLTADHVQRIRRGATVTLPDPVRTVDPADFGALSQRLATSGGAEGVVTVTRRD